MTSSSSKPSGGFSRSERSSMSASAPVTSYTRTPVSLRESLADKRANSSSRSPGSRSTSWVRAARSPGGSSTNSRYVVKDDDLVVSSRTVSHRVAPNDFPDAGATWENLTTLTAVGSTLTVTLSDLANNRVIADAVRVQQIEGDQSGDDDFHVQPGAPGIDAGDLASYSLAETMP